MQAVEKKKLKFLQTHLQDAFAKISELLGDDFKRRKVLEADNTPRCIDKYLH